MSTPISCNPCCSSNTTTQIPGPAGADATVLTPIGGTTPEGVQVATPGQTILCTGNDSWWVKKTGTGNTGWINLLACLVLLLSLTFAQAQPVLRGPFTTNLPAAQLQLATNIADGRIAVDQTKMPASVALTNLAGGNGSGLTNIPPSGLASPKYTGIITNKSTLGTNTFFFSSGVLTNATITP